MNNSIKQSVWFCSVLVLLACSSWYFATDKALVKLDDKTLSKTADMFVTDLTINKFDATGALMHHLVSPHMKHYPQDDSYIFQNPLITISQKEQPNWDIRSEEAQLVQGGETITFSKKVVVHQNSGDKNQESTLSTEKIVYYPKEKKATSDVLVTYEQPGNRIQSTGMTAYLAEKRVQLLHQARGKYVPKVG